MIEAKRKGSRSTKDISKDIFELLNTGQIETANLVEWLAIDQKVLLGNLLKQSNRTEYLKQILADIDSLQKRTVNTINEAIGTGLFLQATKNKDVTLIKTMATHTSDSIRCWATYAFGKNSNLSVKQMLQKIQPFAADKHFGVREISWLAVRSSIAKNLAESIKILSSWTSHKDPNVRRFASESTRPRGVWCEHIDVLKQKPELGLPILEPLKSDPEKYVQDSVANWLNDASKTQPAFVIAICKRWQKESKTSETNYIIKRALRTIEK
jgi:3-methyladenine DNA glycosylase AlkC